jgi:hypothetical protein
VTIPRTTRIIDSEYDKAAQNRKPKCYWFPASTKDFWKKAFSEPLQRDPATVFVDALDIGIYKLDFRGFISSLRFWMAREEVLVPVLDRNDRSLRHLHRSSRLIQSTGYDRVYLNDWPEELLIRLVLPPPNSGSRRHHSGALTLSRRKQGVLLRK